MYEFRKYLQGKWLVMSKEKYYNDTLWYVIDFVFIFIII